ncbi:MAG: hypothetical protein OXE95_12210 [Chloroflexi bacterium]|nr:hypothetical protein [Chloroflexota bacterium]MCY4248325.1 hypothetical protein [Chloroflexota bacterium]
MSVILEQLRLAPNDTLASIRASLSQLRGKRVVLIWTPDCDNLKRRLDLVLIQREADRNAIQLAIVAQDPSLQAHAAELNISCFDCIEASQNQRWKRSRNKVFLPRYHRPRADLQAADLAQIADRLAASRQKNKWRIRLARAAVILLLCAVMGALVYVIAPGAVVRVSLRSERVGVEVEVIADAKAAAVEQARALIPAIELRETVQTSASIPSSGREWLEGESAVGVATFTNLTSQPVDIPAGTALSASAGEPVLFVTSADGVVPAGIGRSFDAAIVAAEGYSGSIGNVDGGMINRVFGPLAERVSVVNVSPTTGGSDRSVQVVAAEDRERLLDIARLQLQSQAYDRMRASLSESHVIVIESLQIVDERKDWLDYSAVVGARSSELSLTMRAVVAALAVDENLARQVALAQLEAAVPPDMTLMSDTLAYERGAFNLSRAKEQIRFRTFSSGVALAALDVAALREQLAGAELGEAQQIMRGNRAFAQQPPPRLSLHPSGFGRMPLLPIRIHIEVQAAS